MVSVQYPITLPMMGSVPTDAIYASEAAALGTIVVLDSVYGIDLSLHTRLSGTSTESKEKIVSRTCCVSHDKANGDNDLCPVCVDLRERINDLQESVDRWQSLVLALCSPKKHQAYLMDEMNVLLRDFLSGPWKN